MPQTSASHLQTPLSVSFIFCYHLPSISQPLGSIFLVGCRTRLSLSRIKIFTFLHGPLGKLRSCLCHSQCCHIPEILMPGEKKKKASSGRMGTLLKLRGDQEPKLLFIEQWLGLVLQLPGMLSTGKAQNPLKAKLGNYVFTRNLGRRNRQNLIEHVLFCQ